METIIQSVGVRNGRQMMPNRHDDVETITELLDRIPAASGGTASIAGNWSTDRTALIAEVTAAIVLFQTVNARPSADGVVDPGGGTLALMNLIAGPAPVRATIVQQDVHSHLWVVADPLSMDGTRPLQTRGVSPSLTRKLIRVRGTSIRWFGVVVPLDQSGHVIGGEPHLFFTPSPSQGGYYDPGYNAFTSWIDLWNKYTSAMGSQLVASGAPQILVIPVYKNSQASNLGEFLNNWQEVISAVLTEAVCSVDPFFLRDRFEFTSISTSSFSNGIVTHQNFNMRGAGVASMTRVAFNLDGQASGNHWNPARGVVYLNTPPPRGVNPVGRHWHVGGRLGPLRAGHPQSSDHNLCPFLLLHGLTRFGR